MRTTSVGLRALTNSLAELENLEKAKIYARFFKTGKGEYGEGDKFLGVTVPEQRKVARAHLNLPLSDIEKLLASDIHEHRFTALVILVWQYAHGDERVKSEIVKFYLANTKNINNWDLVDTSALQILGHYFFSRKRFTLYRLARSNNLWEKRMSIISTLYFIRQRELEDAIRISEILLHDEHDLIHKAVGWMLREAGNRDVKTLEGFLKEHADEMPRTMLRYAIEKLPETERRAYLTKKTTL